MKGFHAKEPLYIFFYNMKGMLEFCKSVKLGSCIKKKICKRLCATLHTIQLMLVDKSEFPFLHFFQYDPKEVKVLTNFLVLG